VTVGTFPSKGSFIRCRRDLRLFLLFRQEIGIRHVFTVTVIIIIFVVVHRHGIFVVFLGTMRGIRDIQGSSGRTIHTQPGTARIHHGNPALEKEFGGRSQKVTGTTAAHEIKGSVGGFTLSPAGTTGITRSTTTNVPGTVRSGWQTRSIIHTGGRSTTRELRSCGLGMPGGHGCLTTEAARHHVIRGSSSTSSIGNGGRNIHERELFASSSSSMRGQGHGGNRIVLYGGIAATQM